MNDNFKIHEAIGEDTSRVQGFFDTDNLTIASIFILYGHEPKLVRFHKFKIGVKVYYFTDSNEIRQLYEDYTNGKMLLDPQKLAIQVSQTKTIPAEKTSYTTPQYTNEYLSSRQQKELNEIRNRKFVSGEDYMKKLEENSKPINIEEIRKET